MPLRRRRAPAAISFARPPCSEAARPPPPQVGDAERLGRLLERSSLHLESDGGGGGSGYTPLHYAARAGSDACVALLLRARARADATTSGGATPLHRAAHQGHTSVCTLLLDAAASPLAQDAAGETALHKAMGERRAETVALLLRRGPDAASLRNRRGLTPAELAPAAEPG